MSALWFVLGVLCGVVGGRLVKASRRGDVEKSRPTAEQPGSTWVETRNFLYYDGTEMPVNKEEK